MATNPAIDPPSEVSASLNFFVAPKDEPYSYLVHPAPRQRWYYAPEMTRDEVLLLKTYDSATDGRARFVAHGAFTDPNAPAQPLPRESIELRALVFC